MENFFKLKERGTDVKTEIMAGVTTFMTMAYILAVNPFFLSEAGMDFGKVYGPAFADKIEVHHLVPISEIGKEYVVDPVKDLVPVCPNCHMALHSKKGGVYTIEELKALLKKS